MKMSELESKIKDMYTTLSGSIDKNYISRKVMEELEKKYKIRIEDKSRLDEIVDETIKQYKQGISSFLKNSSKLTGLYHILYNISQFESIAKAIGTTVALPEYVAGANFLLASVKTLLESPLIVKYLLKTKDIKGGGEWLYYRLLDFIPVIGPFLSGSSMDKVLTHGIIRRVKKKVLKEKGIYKDIHSLIEEKVKETTGVKPYYHPIYSYA